MKNIQLKCQCSCEALEFQYDQEETDGQYYVSIWRKGYQSPLSFKERLRWCWNILTTGKLWGDEVVLDKKQILQLKNWLNKH